GPITQVVDLVVPTQFTNYTQQHTELKSNIVRAGALVRDALLDRFLGNSLQVPGGLVYNIPSLQDLARTPARISTDAAHPTLFSPGGGFEPTPEKLGSTFEMAVRLSRNQSWSDANLARVLSGISPLAAAQNLVGQYWTDELQATFIALWKGVF